jgi:hypothetical protein
VIGARSFVNQNNNIFDLTAAETMQQMNNEGESRGDNIRQLDKISYLRESRRQLQENKLQKFLAASVKRDKNYVKGTKSRKEELVKIAYLFLI